MMRFRFFQIFVLTLALGCKKAPSLSFSHESFTEKNLEICQKDPCSKITIDYIIVFGNDESTEKINTQIKAQIIQALFLGEDEKPSAKSIEDASKQFIMAYRDHKSEFEYELEYEAEISVSEIFSSEAILSLQFQNYLFTGGAHGYGSTFFRNFDLQTGKEITISDIFDDYDGFLKMAESTFRKKNNIPENESINTTGFWFDEDTFSLPETMGMSKNELLFIYNVYDITSYADGPIRFKISKKEASPYLKKEFL